MEKQSNSISKPVAVYGAGGHTGQFVVRELQRCAIPVRVVGRDVARLPTGMLAFAASIDDHAALDRAFANCALVINCAGPYLDTAAPVIEAALRAGCSYLDVTAEQASAQASFDDYEQTARSAGVTVIPAAGFYGGLADLLASALSDEAEVESIVTATFLDHWWPTQGTRLTGLRNTVPRLAIQDGRLEDIVLPPHERRWSFDPPFGVQPMVELSFSEINTISRHLPVRNLRSYLNAGSLDDVRNPATAAPTAIDSEGRSAQRFVMDVVATGNKGVRRARARGQDIYAVSARIVVEAAQRLLASSFKTHGALSLGQAFDAREYLAALSPALTIDYISH